MRAGSIPTRETLVPGRRSAGTAGRTLRLRATRGDTPPPPGPEAATLSPARPDEGGEACVRGAPRWALLALSATRRSSPC